MQIFFLFFKYAWRSIRRGGQRTFFAILCVAVGVASIVALQSTGNAINDTLTGNAREGAAADVVVTNRGNFFTPQDLAKFDSLKQSGTIVDYTTWIYLTVEVDKPNGLPSNDFDSVYSLIAVDPSKYPLYGKANMESPKGKSLQEVLRTPDQIVLNKKMAKLIEAKAGDKITLITDRQVQFEVVGILDTKLSSSPGNQAEFLGFGFTTPEAFKKLYYPQALNPQQIFVKTASNSQADDKAKAAIQAQSPRFIATTSAERNKDLKASVNSIKDILTYAGLLSLLIGCVGVVNTMLVVVGRRSTEIATIKALGMESGQTVRIFMLEAAILGLFGSVLGVILGEILALITSRAAESLVNQPLEYRLYWSPIVMGMVVGVITAVVFGLLPAYAASKIPPAQVLRQKTSALPRIPLAAGLSIIALMTLIMGVLCGIILEGNIGAGIIVAFVTLVICTVLVGVYSGILWIVGKIPLPLGLNYKMARRNLSRSRARSATTLLVMTVGVFAMTLLLLLTTSLKDNIKSTIENSFGYNLQVYPKSDEQTAQVKTALDSQKVDGLEKYIYLSGVNLRWVGTDKASAEELIARKTARDEADNGQLPIAGSGLDMSSLAGMNQADLPSLMTLKEGTLYNGENQATLLKGVKDAYGINIGDKLIFQDLVAGQKITLQVVGIVDLKSPFVSVGPVQTTVQTVQNIDGHANQFCLNVSRDKVDGAEEYLQQNFPGLNATNVSAFLNIFYDILDQVTAFPLLIGFLCLISGAVLIANNVALAVLDRRTEMGVMKSLGANNNRVLTIINLESGVVGLLGGIFGLLYAIITAYFLVSVFGTADNPGKLDVPPLVCLGMVALALVLAIGATLVSAWGTSQEKPMVVLRYE